MDTTATIPLAQILQARGLRPSPQRTAVYKYLYYHSKQHPSVDTIYTKLAPEYPTLSRTTVYQTLEALHECGLVVKLTVEDGEMRFDAETHSHGHFKCIRCGKVSNVYYPEGTPFPKVEEGYTVKETHLYYRGVCPQCNKPEK